MSALHSQPDDGGGRRVSGPGAYGGLEEPADDDTGLRRPAATVEHDARHSPAADCHLTNEEYLTQKYGAAEETGVAGTEVHVSQASAAPASPRTMHQEHLTVFDDDM